MALSINLVLVVKSGLCRISARAVKSQISSKWIFESILGTQISSKWIFVISEFDLLFNSWILLSYFHLKDLIYNSILEPSFTVFYLKFMFLSRVSNFSVPSNFTQFFHSRTFFVAIETLQKVSNRFFEAK